MNNKKLNSKYYGRNIFLNILEVFHLLIILFIRAIVSLICYVIIIITYERNSSKVLTERKARRIRALTNFKLWFYRHFKGLSRFLRFDEYFRHIEKRFEK